ncbi:MAG: purine-nucleoside phosphorylase [Paracoccaceae bacterium]
MKKNFVKKIELAAEYIGQRISQSPEVLLILGSGLGDVTNEISKEAEISYKEIPEFPFSTAPSHAGNLVSGNFNGRHVLVMQGRLHLYEGWKAYEIAFPIRVAKSLGVKKMIVTNAAGALNTSFEPGSIMMLTDHINFTGQNPLIGPHDDELGLRFPDMSDVYDKKVQGIVSNCFKNAGIKLSKGIYAGIMGPSLETSAERRFLKGSGADAVGMSTVMEVIAAKQAGFEIAGLSAITNKADGGSEQQPDTIEEVLEYASVAGKKIKSILPELLQAWT